MTYPIIDSHCHIYPDAIAHKAVASIGQFYNIPMCQDGTEATLLQSGDEAGIGHYVVFSVATKPTQTKTINEYIADAVARSNGKMTGLGTVHPDSPDLASDIRHIQELGLKGVKLHPDIQQFKLDDYRCLKIYELCEGTLPVLLHTGDYRYDYSNPNRLRPILDIFSNLTVIGAHFGGWSIWEQAAKELAEYPNFYVDCSSSLYALSPEKAREIVRTYGADRVLFATDYPMWTYTDELKRFFAMELTEEENHLILHRNAERLFDISPRE